MATRPLPPSAARTVSTSDTKATLDTIVSNVVTGEDVILERDGTPAAVVISMDEYRDLQAMREKARRMEVLRRFDALTDRLKKQNTDLSAKDINDLAQRFSREIREERFLAAQKQLNEDQQSDEPTT